MNVQAFIDNISFPKNLEELEDFVDEFDVEQVLRVDETEWTAPKWAVEGDIVFFFTRRLRFNGLRNWKQG